MEPRDQQPPDIKGLWRLCQLVEEGRRQERMDHEFLLLDGTLNALVRAPNALERPVRRPLNGAAPKPPEESG